MREAPEVPRADPRASETIWSGSPCGRCPSVSRDPPRHATRSLLIVSSGVNKLSLLQARLVGKLILSNYTDVTAAFQHVIKIWPASFCFHSLMGKEKTEIELNKSNIRCLIVFGGWLLVCPFLLSSAHCAEKRQVCVSGQQELSCGQEET